jgi:hypothetical protein
MAAKTRSQATKRRNAKTNPPAAYAVSMVSMATQSLVNMVAVSAVSGAFLLTILAARHF